MVTEGLFSKLGGAQSPPSLAPIQHLSAVKTEVLSDHKIAQSPPPPSVSTQPLSVKSNPTQSSRQPPPISSPPGQTTPVVPIPSITQSPPPSSASTQPLPVTPNHGSAQSSWQPQPSISSPPDRTTPVVPISPIAQPPPPSSASTQPLLVVPNHRPAKSSRQPPPDRTTPVTIPITKPMTPSRHYQTPLNVSQERQPQACAFSNETLNISVKVGMTSQFSPNLAITSHISRDESSRSVASHAEPLVSKLEGPTSNAPKQDVTPPPLQTQSQKPAQRPLWQVWFQKVWTGGK